MVTIEQKLALFSKLLQQDIKDEISEKIALIEEEYKQKQKEHNEAVDKEARQIVDKAIKKAKIKKTEIVSKAKMNTKKQTMISKEKCVNLCIDHLESYINQFIQSGEYRDYLLSVVNKVQDLGDLRQEAIVYITQEDMDRYKEDIMEQLIKIGFYKEFIRLEAYKNQMIGGVIIDVPSENIRVDLSIATLINDHKSIIVERVFEAIEQVGEVSES